MATSRSTSSPRDHAADANPDLARKKQRLGDDQRDASPEDSIIIEASEPEDMGTDFTSAIQIEDDLAFTTEPYSAAFRMNDIDEPVIDQLRRLENDLLQNRYIDPRIFANLAESIVGHITETSDRPNDWRQHYLEDEAEFFGKLATVSISLFDTIDVFDPERSISPAEMRRALQSFTTGLHLLCSRIVPLLPDAIKSNLARRDSAQTSTKVQLVGALYYVVLAFHTLTLQNQLHAWFRKYEKVSSLEKYMRDNQAEFYGEGMIITIATVIETLTKGMREIKDSWLVLQYALDLFRLGLGKHVTGENYPSAEADKVLDVVDTFILPAVCAKHSGALPDRFHPQLVDIATYIIHSYTLAATKSAACSLYERHVKTEADAILSQIDLKHGIETSLWSICDDDRQIVAKVLATSWALQAFRAFIRSDIMDVRHVGVELWSDRLRKIYHESRDNAERFDYPVAQLAIRFLRENEITLYMFGPESRASLICHSKDIICFLAATSAYTDAETDIIWKACSTSVEADFVKASFGILESLLEWLNYHHLTHIVQNYASTQTERLGVDAVSFLKELLRAMDKKRSSLDDGCGDLPLTFAFVDLLKAANTSSDRTGRNSIHNCSVTALKALAKPSSQFQDKFEVYKQSISEIRKRASDSTSYVEVLNIFLAAQIPASEAEHVSAMLPIGIAVDELYDFVQNRDIGPQAQPLVEGVMVRLECIIRLMNHHTETLDSAADGKLFDAVFGQKAAGNDARNQAWVKLKNLASVGPTKTAATKLWEGFLQNRVPSMDVNIVTPELVQIIGSSLKTKYTAEAQNPDSTDPVTLPLWKALVRFATVAEDNRVAEVSVDLILQLLFTDPSTTKIPLASVIQRQRDFVRDHIRTFSKDCEILLQTDLGAAARIFGRGVFLLDALLMKSGETASIYTTTNQCETIMLSDGNDESEAVHFTAQVYGPFSEPRFVDVRAKADNRVSELIAVLPQRTGAAENRIIVGGVEVSLQPEQTLSEVRGQYTGAIMIQPKHSVGSDLDKVLTCPGPVEQEIISHYATLEFFLDAPIQVSQLAYHFLQHIRTSAEARRQTTSPTASIEVLFPRQNQLRSQFSLTVLQQHLFDYVKIGVIDSEFIAKSIRMLVSVLLDEDRPLQPFFILEAAACLTKFFLNLSPPISDTDRLNPRDDGSFVEAVSYFQDKPRWVSRMISLISEGMTSSIPATILPDMFPLRRLFTTSLYGALVESGMVDNSVWGLLAEHPHVVNLHQSLLLDTDLGISYGIALCMKNIFRDSRASSDISKAYWEFLTPSLSVAMHRGSLSESYFGLLIETFTLVQLGEGEIRSLIDRCTSELWFHRHQETIRLPMPDTAFTGLLRLLETAITFLKSYKKPLRLGEFPPRLMQQLLFPPRGNPTSHPLTNGESRSLAYNLVRWTFESALNYEELVDLTRDAVDMSVREAGAKFPGHTNWIRPSSAAAGVDNLGMTCYMNSLLQQLFANLQFRKFILDQPMPVKESMTPLFELQMLFANMQNSTLPCALTSRLAQALNVQTNNQEDVHMFYTSLLSVLEEDVIEGSAKETLGNFFTGKSITQIKGDCGHVSSRTEAFTELSITVKNKASLEDSLDEFVQGEPLEGANKYKCMTCDSPDSGRLVNAVKRACLELIPDNLTFCLKRFTYESMNGGEDKVNDEFKFPKAIDMSYYKRNYLEDPSGKHDSDVFELVGVIVHQGSLQFGHYWSYARVPGSSLDADKAGWLYLEDHKTMWCKGVEEVQAACFGGPKWPNGADRADNAYVLFYQRQSYIAEAQRLNTVSEQSRSLFGLLPEVELQSDMASKVISSNEWRREIATLFEPSFGEFMVWLLGQWPAVLSKRESVNGDSGQPDDSSAASNRELEGKIGNLIAQYALRILLADPKADVKIQPFMTALTTVLESSPLIAGDILRVFCDRDGFAFSNIVQQYSTKVRSHFFTGIEHCMSLLREKAPEVYEAIVPTLVDVHASIIGLPLDNARGRWDEYFAFAGNFAKEGFPQTGLILGHGYIAWILDILNMRGEVEARKRHLDLYNWCKVNQVDFSSLYGFLFNVFRGHMDLSEYHNNLASGMEERTCTANGWCLREEEVGQLLNTRKFNGHEVSFLLYSAVQSCTPGAEWKPYEPGRLIGLLVSDRSNPPIAVKLEELLMYYMEYEDHRLTPMLFLALHFCDNRTDEDCKRLISHLSKQLIQWDQCEEECTWFFEQAYDLAPIAVLSSLHIWGAKFLSAKRLADRKKVAAFLRDRVLMPTPLSDDSSLDGARCNAVRTITDQLMHSVEAAYNREAGRGFYEAMIDGLQEAKEYFSALQEAVKQAREDGSRLGQEVLVEYDESRVVATRLDGLLDVVQYWEPQTTLPTRSHDVRKSVELDTDDVEEQSDVEEEDEEDEELSSEPELCGRD